MKAMVLAAGRGSRLAPLTDHCPKPLLEVGGETLLDRVLDQLEQAGFEDIVVNVSWLGEKIKQHLANCRRAARITISDESRERLETGGGICTALPHLAGGPFAVVNADVLTDFSAARLAHTIQAWDAGTLAHLVLVPNPVHNCTGDFSVSEGRLRAGGDWTFAGLSVLTPELFEGYRPHTVFPLVKLLRDAMAKARVSAEVHSGYWNDVGTSERLMLARDWVEQQRQ